MGRPAGVPNKDKPFRDALRIEAKALENGEERSHPKGSLRWNAQQLLMKGDPVAIREIADRLDGRVPQAIGGTHELPAIKGISWLSDQTALSESITTQESNSSTSTSEPSDGLASWPTDGQAKQ